MRKLCCFLVTLLLTLPLGGAWAQELVTTDQVSFTVTGFVEDDDLNLGMGVVAVNKTDKPANVAIRSASVNGVMNDPFWAREVAAGSTLEETVWWSDLWEPAAQVEFCFTAYDAEDFLADPYVEKELILYPRGEENAMIHQRAAGDSDLLLLEYDALTMIAEGFYQDEDFGFYCDCYLVNHTDKTLMVACEAAAVNGYDMDPFWSCEVGPGKQAYSTIFWWPNALAENGIEDVVQIDLTLKAYDANDWNAEDLVWEAMTLTFQ